jgi:uracil-DNA glycosylase
MKKKMPKLELAKRLVATLPISRSGLYNPWAEVCPDDLRGNGPELKLLRLAAHLDCRPNYILCGEAIGFAGGRHSGVAFTSERLILERKIPRLTADVDRLTIRNLPFSEPSATIVWKTLTRLGIAENTILWNSLQLHPYRPGNIRSNRTPTPAEIALGKPAMMILLGAFPKAKIIAVGRKAEGLLLDIGVPLAGAVRHPANGGATAFAKGLDEIAR